MGQLIGCFTKGGRDPAWGSGWATIAPSTAGDRWDYRNVTLVDEVLNPSSSLSVFLRERLPGRDAVVGRWTEQVALSPSEPVRLDWGHRARLGSAFELRLGFDLAEEVPYQDVLAMVPSEETGRILAAAGLRQAGAQGPASAELGGWRRRDDWDPRTADEQLHRDAWNLAEFAGLLRKVGRPDRDQWRGLYGLMRQQLWQNGFPGSVADAMTALWRTYLDVGRPDMIRLGRPRLVQPVFDHAFAVGDLVLGDTLVDVKVYADPAPSLQTFLDQLLGYVFCDTEDVFGLRAVGLYLGWQGRLLTAQLHDVLPAGPQDPATHLAALRVDFQAAIRSDLERSRFYKHGATPD